MERLPGAVFVIDPKREELLVKEANRLKIPVLALTDTNCDPEVVDYVIPGNDDAIRSISLISRLVADAIIQGRGEEAQPDERPVPPVIEDATVEAEGQQVAAANGSTDAPSAEPETGHVVPEAVPETEATADPNSRGRGRGRGRARATESRRVVETMTEVEAEVVEPEVALGRQKRA